MLGIRAGGLTTASRRTQVSARDFYSSMKAHKLGLAVLEEKVGWLTCKQVGKMQAATTSLCDVAGCLWLGKDTALRVRCQFFVFLIVF